MQCSFKLVNRHWAVLTGSLLSGLVMAQSAPTELFSAPAIVREAPAHLITKGVVRSREVILDKAALNSRKAKEFVRARRLSPLTPGGRSIPSVMNFFDDVRYSVRWTDVTQTDDHKGLVWTGRVEDAPNGHAVLVVVGDSVTGNVSGGDNLIYQVRTTEDGRIFVIELDQFKLPREALPRERPRDLEMATVQPAAAAAGDDAGTIDVMVAYTATARAAAGGTGGMMQLVQLGIAETNQGYANSGVNHRLRLVHTLEVNYRETGDLGDDLDSLTSTSDGILDELHQLRQSYGADLVSLWVEDGGSACGIGYLFGNPTRPNPATGFSVVARGCATGNFSFGHEVGHNLGATHARDDPGGAGSYSYSYGFKNLAGSRFRTVMAYNDNCNCPRINYWSNPAVAYNGVATGNPNNGNAPTNNVLTMNNTAAGVANYLQSRAGGGGGGTPGLPESDHPYADSLDRTWTASLAGAAALAITFDTRTAVEDGYDYIDITDASGNRISGSPFTGTQLSGRTVTVPGSGVRIRLVSDDSIRDWGFKVNSITSVRVGTSQARLVVTSLTAPTAGEPGQRLTGTRVVVANQGTDAAGRFRIGYYLGRSSAVSRSDIFTGTTCTLAGLAPGASTSCSGDISIPGSVIPGSYYLAAIADDLEEIPQVSRSGNVRTADTGQVLLGGGIGAVMVSPVAGSLLTGSTVTFRWGGGVGVDQYYLAVGRSATGTEFVASDMGLNTSYTATRLPTDGSTVYVRLSSRFGTRWTFNSYTYRAASATAQARLSITSLVGPRTATVGQRISDVRLALTNAGTAAAGAFRVGYYWSQAPATRAGDVFSGWFCLFESGLAAGASNNCSGEVGVPGNLANGTWYLVAIADDRNQVPQADRSGSVRVADSGAIIVSGQAKADLTSPAPGAAINSSTVTFRWNPGVGAEQYFLAVGTGLAAADIYNADAGLSLSATVTGIPLTGGSIYARLYSRFGDDWRFTDYSFGTIKLTGGTGTAPRLVVTTLTAATQASIGGNLSGTRMVVANQGTANAGPFRVGYYFGRTPNVSASDVYSGWFCNVENGLPVGQTYTCSGAIGVPTTLSAGIWYLAAIADDRSQIQQLDRGGNIRVSDSGPITITDPAAGASGRLPESEHPYADNTDRSWTYSIAGAPSLEVTFDAQTRVETGFDYIFVYDGAGNQIAGSPFTGSQLAGRKVLVPGTTVRIRLTSDDSVTDYGFKVTSVSPGAQGPKIAITALTVPTSARLGVNLQGMSMRLTNQGAAAGPFRVGFYWGRSPNVTTRDVDSLWSCNYPDGLAAGASTSCGGEVGVPSSLGGGVWYLAAIADSEFKLDGADRSAGTRVADSGPISVVAGDQDRRMEETADGMPRPENTAAGTLSVPSGTPPR